MITVQSTRVNQKIWRYKDMRATYKIIWRGIRNGKAESQSIKTFDDYNKAEAWLNNYVKENGYALSDFMMKRSEA